MLAYKRHRHLRGSLCLILWTCPLVLSIPVFAQEEEAEPHSPVEITHDDSGNAMLNVDHETQSRIGLTVGLLKEETMQPEVTAFGILEDDPAGMFTVRSPLAGYLRVANDVPWPRLGETVVDGATIATVEPRLTPTESLDLLTRWMDARAEVDEVSAELEAARSSYESKKRLNEEGKVVSDRSLEEAEAKFKSAEARLAAVRERVEAFEQAMPNRAAPPRLALIAAVGGEVVEVTARPDEVVESGQAVLRVARFDTLIARVAAPANEELPDRLPKARVTVLGREDEALSADPIGRAPLRDATTRGDTLLYRIQVGRCALRPGAPVAAHIPKEGEPIAGAIVPRSAVLRYAGFAWVYVAVSDTQFSRRAIELVSPLVEGWFVTSGVGPGESVIISAAQSLLSEELKAQIESEEAAEE